MGREPLDQAVAHRSTRRPDAGRHVGCIAQQADRAFGYYLRGRSVTGIAVALDRDVDLTAIRRYADEQQIVMAALAHLLRGALARLRTRAAHPLGIHGCNQAPGVGFARSEEHTSELQSRFGISYAV